jgi:hypothetical protein
MAKMKANKKNAAQMVKTQRAEVKARQKPPVKVTRDLTCSCVMAISFFEFGMSIF